MISKWNKYVKQTIWRGEGGGGDATTDSEINFITSLTNSIVADTALTTANAAASAASALAAATSESNAAASEIAAASSASAASASAISADASANSAANSYDSFDDRYLGSKTVAPTLDNDGNVLLVGALYWNSVTTKLFVWSGTTWRDGFFTGLSSSLVTATAGQTVVTTPSYTQNTNTIQVYVNGLKVISGTDFTETSSTSITFSSGLTLNDEVEIVIVQSVSIGTTLASNVSYTPTGTIAAANVQDALSELSSEKVQSTVLASTGGAALVGNTPSGTIAATTVQGAINEIVSDLASSNGSSLVGYLPSGTGAVAATVQSKLRESVSVKDFGAVGDGVTDDTAAIQSAMTAAGAVGVPLQFGGATYIVSASSDYALTAPASITLLGVPGTTTIKLLSTTANTHIIGRSSTSTYFRMEGITLDGNKSVISTLNTGGLYFSNAQVVISRNNIFKNMNDLGVYASKCVYVEAPVLGEYAESTGDQYINCEGYPFQTYRIARNIVKNAYCTGAMTSFTDINGQTIPSNIYAKTQINNNVVICDSSFPTSYSVLSLMGNDVECVGNKINGGSTQIVVHSGTTETLYNYLVSGNFLWQSKSNGIVVNQGSGTSATNSNVVVTNNMIYQPTTDGIVVVGTYTGGSTTPQANTTISGNVIYDYLTNNPSAGSTISSIRLLSTVNATVSANSIVGPRWAGICVHYDGRNIDIIGNVISDHQGRVDTSSQHGGPIFVSSGGSTAYLGNINITGNTIRNYCSTVSPAATSVRTGGIVVNEANAQDITIRNNRIMNGNASGISLYNCARVTAMYNEVTGFGAGTTALNTVSGIGVGCQLAYAISGPAYDTTANRPLLQSTQSGYSMWDSTLAKPIWWNGSVWKDAANATV